mmetsp:Transcript_33062/g.95752  ORF Transcript_33062/g.95752 Transcript_33062/m.95752 type:complete len:205 (-) Transcript_33062:1663-2277(-)
MGWRMGWRWAALPGVTSSGRHWRPTRRGASTGRLASRVWRRRRWQQPWQWSMLRTRPMEVVAAAVGGQLRVVQHLWPCPCSPRRGCSHHHLRPCQRHLHRRRQHHHCQPRWHHVQPARPGRRWPGPQLGPPLGPRQTSRRATSPVAGVGALSGRRARKHPRPGPNQNYPRPRGVPGGRGLGTRTKSSVRRKLGTGTGSTRGTLD